MHIQLFLKFLFVPPGPNAHSLYILHNITVFHIPPFGARIFKPVRSPRNRFPGWRAGSTTLFDVQAARLRMGRWNRFMGSLNVYTFGLSSCSSPHPRALPIFHCIFFSYPFFKRCLFSLLPWKGKGSTKLFRCIYVCMYGLLGMYVLQPVVTVNSTCRGLTGWDRHDWKTDRMQKSRYVVHLNNFSGPTLFPPSFAPLCRLPYLLYFLLPLSTAPHGLAMENLREGDQCRCCTVEDLNPLVFHF